MKFLVCLNIYHNSNWLKVEDWLASIKQGELELSSSADTLGFISLKQGERFEAPELEEPLVRFLERWIRALEWILAGDTETLLLLNSLNCLVLMPHGKRIEVELFEGPEPEAENSLFPPFKGDLIEFCLQSIAMGEALLRGFEAAGFGPQIDEGARALSESVGKAQKVLHNFQIHQR